MKHLRGLGVHLLLLGAATTAALLVWTHEETDLKPVAGEVELWRADAPAVTRISFKSDKRSVVIEPNKDDTGRWFVVDVEKQKSSRTTPTETDPHASLMAPDAGPEDAPDGGAKADAKDPKAAPPVLERLRFVGVTAAEKLLGLLSPLKAARVLGQLADERKGEFGFDKPEGVLSVTVSGAEHKLELGGEAPGGEFRYARDPASRESFAVPAEIAQLVLYAENRLLERELHGFKPEDVTSVRVMKGDRERELVPLAGKADGWADATSKETLDETAGNWMSKVSRLRISEYVEKPELEVKAEHLVVRLEFKGGADVLGYLELVKLPGGENKPLKYLAKTEFTRWYAQVLSASAEEIEQDLASVLK